MQWRCVCVCTSYMCVCVCVPVSSCSDISFLKVPLLMHKREGQGHKERPICVKTDANYWLQPDRDPSMSAITLHSKCLKSKAGKQTSWDFLRIQIGLRRVQKQILKPHS